MRNYSNNNAGFSAIEMLLALVLVGLIMYTTLSFSNSLLNQSSGQVVTNQAYNYSQAVIRYITTHQGLLRQILSENGATNGKMATVSTQVLVNEGFIKNNLYFKNSLNQYPCTVIWYDANQLQAFIYYRDNNDSRKLNKNQLMYGLNHMGAMIGIYENSHVIGAAKDWSMDNNFVNNMFIKQGTADISQGSNPAQYYCFGGQIAIPSYVVNVTSMLALNNRLPNDDTIYQYQDILHDVDESQSNNRMNSDLNLDYTNPRTLSRTQSNVIFQMNPNCQMNPTVPATMQDFDANVDGSKPMNFNKPNSLGCRNLQLAIQAVKDPINQAGNMDVMMVTGFQRGGDPSIAGWKDNGKDLRPFVGEVRAASLQPTSQIAVGDPCDPREVGTMAQQQRSPDPEDINNIYVSQVICMKSPLCEQNTKGYCYMPVQNITLQIQPNSKTYTCPIGTFIDDASIAINRIDIQNKITCVANKGSVVYPEVNCVATNPSHDPLIHSDLLNTAFRTQVPLYRTLILPSTRWEQWCGNPVHGGCGEGPGQIADTQDTISKIQCTNDPSKAAIIIQN